MGQASAETEDRARRSSDAPVTDPSLADGPAAATALRLCGRFTNGIDAKSRVVMPAAFRAPFAVGGGMLTPWRGTVPGRHGPQADFDTYEVDVAAADLVRRRGGRRGLRPPAPSGAPRSTFALDLQGRMVLPEEVRSQVGITEEVRFQGRGLAGRAVARTEISRRGARRAGGPPGHPRHRCRAAYIPEIES